MLRLLPLGFLASLVPAQGASDFVLPDDAVVVQIDGPETLRMAFLPTSLGSLLAAREARDFWSLLGEPLLAHASKMSRVDSGRALAALLGYRGRITLAVGVGDQDDDEIDGVVVLAPDGETDLAALRDRTAAFLKGGRETDAPVTIDARWVKTYQAFGRVAVTSPVLINDHLVLFFGSQLDTGTIRRRRAPHAVTHGTRWKADAEFAASPIAVRLNLPELLSSKGASWVGDEKLAGLLGFHSLEELRLLARPTGPRVEIEVSVLFDRDERGIFAGILPASTKPPSLVGLVPPDHPDWAAGKFGMGTLVEAVVKAVEAWAPSLIDAEDWVDVREAAAAMSEDYVQLGSLLGENGDSLGEFCLAFEIRDTKTFDAGFWRALGEDATKHAEAIAAGELVTHRENFMDETVYARWRNLVFVYHGEQGEAWFEQMFELARKSHAAGDEVVTPKEIQKLRRAAGPGFQGCAALDIRHLARALPGLRVLWPVEAEYQDHVRLVRDLTAELAPLLEKYDCSQAHVLTEWNAHRWRARLFW